MRFLAKDLLERVTGPVRLLLWPGGATIAGIMQWGPAVLIILVFAPQVISAMRDGANANRDQAAALSDLSTTIRQHMEEQHGVRIAVSMMVARFDDTWT